MQADPQADRRQPAGDALAVVRVERVRDGQRGVGRGARRGGRIVVARDPERHHAVAHVLVDEAALALHLTGQQREVAVEQVGRRLRAEALRHVGVAGDVGEAHGRRARFRGKPRLAFRHQPADQAFRHVALEPAQRLDHGVERARLVVDFADGAGRDAFDPVEVEIADLAGDGGELADRPGKAAGRKHGDADAAEQRRQSGEA